MQKDTRIYLSGHRGMVGSTLHRRLQTEGYTNIIIRTSSELDLRNQQAVLDFFEAERPEVVYMIAAKVGGIQANRTYPADFLYDNLMIEANLFNASKQYGVEKVLFFGSSCIYPINCEQPMKEEYLLTGPVEPTNEGYAIAKITGLKMANYFREQYGLNTICPMPCNLYGPNDSFHPEHSHVLSALVRKFVDAVDEGRDTVEMWGTGIARREFLHVEDVVDACQFLMENYDEPDIINVGSGKDITIKELAELIAKKVGFTGTFAWDPSKPDGMLRKLLDVSKMTELGWTPKISFDEGLDDIIAAYRESKKA